MLARQKTWLEFMRPWNAKVNQLSDEIGTFNARSPQPLKQLRLAVTDLAALSHPVSFNKPQTYLERKDSFMEGIKNFNATFTKFKLGVREEGLKSTIPTPEASPEPEMSAEKFNEPGRTNDLGSNAKKTITNTIGMKLNLIPAGSFRMGSPAREEDRGGDEYQHKVTISNPFYMQATEVTQGQWMAVMGTEPWKGNSSVKAGPNYAASYINWNDAVAYCKNLSEKEGKTYRLPTEAEWEYACRGGTQTTWNLGTDEKALGDYAWYRENAYDIGERYAHQVGLKIPNAFGLHDMHGNVFEWCDDYYAEDYYQQSPTKDPQGPASGSSRVLRGGSWSGYSSYSRSAFRGRLAAVGRYPDLFGFRLVLELD
jgi:formylglycine-generating enzyme required for sulfatase activity